MKSCQIWLQLIRSITVLTWWSNSPTELLRNKTLNKKCFQISNIKFHTIWKQGIHFILNCFVHEHGKCIVNNSKVGLPPAATAKENCRLLVLGSLCLTWHLGAEHFLITFFCSTIWRINYNKLVVEDNRWFHQKESILFTLVWKCGNSFFST